LIRDFNKLGLHHKCHWLHCYTLCINRMPADCSSRRL